MTERYPVAYIRRSAADDSNPGDVSREAQEAAVRDLAARDGHNGELRLFADWGRSADEAKESKRAAFLSMLAAIERGEVSSVYAHSLDRLYRSMKTFLRLTDAARTNGVRIVTQREGVLGGDGSPMARAFSEITAVFTSLELNTIKARNQAAYAARKARGDKMGIPPYGFRMVRDKSGTAVKPIRWEDDPARPLGPILEAYRRAGSVLGACKLLTAAGMPTAYGKREWQAPALTLILGRAGVLPPRGTRRHYSHDDLLAGLLRCHCGRTMTPDHANGRYYCGRSKIAPDHGRGSVRQRAVLPLIRAEADRLCIPADAVALGEQSEAAREGLSERKRRLGMAFVDKLLEESDYRAELAKLAEEVDQLDAAAEIVNNVHLDWTAPPAVVNAALRALFHPIQLGPDMQIPFTEGRPEIRWRVPEWRA